MAEEKTQVQNISDLLAQVRKNSAYLICVTGSSVGKMFKLTQPEMVIGRSSEADISINDDGISRRHAKIVVRPDGSVNIVDLGSTNGTFYDGNRVDVHSLRDGDKIQIGSTTILKFSYQDNLDEQYQKNLYESATRDPMTRVYNKKYFADTFRKDFSYCLRHRVPLSLVILDVDHFKKVNDTHGHQAGDFVLTRLATKIQETIRTEDVFARYGGEEFVLLLRECEEDKGFIFCERIRRLIESTDFTFENKKIPVTCSLGLATLSDAEYPGPDEMIAAADKYLYRAKQSGRNRVEAKMLSR
ncbi:MAG: GGDEF domain-containing protein [Deltaproteobacteria bacterium]|nr:GGDEF domain-containing protein [Deltaproteobacteria bacterium]